MQREEQIDISNVKFAIGMPGYGMIPAETMFSLINSIRELDRHQIQLSLCFEFRNSLVDSARNNVVNMFLKSEADKLIFIDSDMSWKEEDLIRLCCLSTLYPVVGAMYSTKVEGNQKFLGTHYKDEKGNLVFDKNGMLRMIGYGLGFMVIDRSVFETMKPKTQIYQDGPNGDIIRFFQTDVQDGKLIGEDIYFLKRWCQEFGGEVWADPYINLGHVGTKVFRGSLPDALKIFQANPKAGLAIPATNNTGKE